MKLVKYASCCLFLFFVLFSCKKEDPRVLKPESPPVRDNKPAEEKKIIVEETLPTIFEQEIGKIKKYSGTVLIKNSVEKKFSKIHTSTLLMHGYMIKTRERSMATIEFNNGDILELYPNSIITLDYRKFRNEMRSRIMLRIGRIWTKAKKRLDDDNELSRFSNLEVYTLSAIAGVRGTAFHVIQGVDGSVRIDVDEGIVEVKSRQKSIQVKKEETSIIPLLENPNEAVKTQETQTILQWDKDCEQNLKENAEMIAEKLVKVVQERDQDFNTINEKTIGIETTLQEITLKPEDNAKPKEPAEQTAEVKQQPAASNAAKEISDSTQKNISQNITEAMIISDHIVELEHQLTAGLELLHEIQKQKLKKGQKKDILKKIKALKDVENHEEQRQQIKDRVEAELPKLANAIVKSNPKVFEKVEEIRKSEPKIQELKTHLIEEKEKNVIETPQVQENQVKEKPVQEKKPGKKEKSSFMIKKEKPETEVQSAQNNTIIPNVNKDIEGSKEIAPKPIPVTPKKSDSSQDYIDEGPAQIKGAEKSVEPLPQLIKEWESIVSLEKDYQTTIKKIDDIIQKSAYHIDNAEKKRRLIHYNQQLEIMYEQGKILLQKLQNTTYEKPEENKKKIQDVAKYYQTLQKMKQKISAVSYQIRGY